MAEKKPANKKTGARGKTPKRAPATSRKRAPRQVKPPSQPPDRVPIPGSESAPPPAALSLRAPNPNERIRVTVFVRSRRENLAAASTGMTEAALPSERRYLTREEYAATYGADPDDLMQVSAFARAQGLEVVEANVAQRTLTLSGTVARFSEAFGATLGLAESPGGTYRVRSGALYVPSALAGIVQGVFGLDNRPAVEPGAGCADPVAAVLPGVGGTFTAPQLAQLYNFPSAVNGAGQTIGLLEFGGGIVNADLQPYFQALGLPQPQVTAVSVNGGQNNPNDPTPNTTLEVMLDIEVSGAIAPGSRIVVYFAPNTFQDFINAINAAIQDAQNNPSVISISWGAAERNWTGQVMNAFDQAVQAAALLGITVCVISHDFGSSHNVNDGLSHADFPGSSPFSLSCGGTSLTAAGNTISSEVVWNNGFGQVTGGGISDQFPVPNYQAGANIPPSANPGGRIGRGVPDVAGHAASYSMRLNGQQISAFGTSAVAPLWAGLVALLNASLPNRVGFLNPALYANPNVFRDITSGNNGAYQAGGGWDACTGLGSPNGALLLSTLNGIPIITWANPASIVYGTPLGPAQLNATASEPGSFSYSPSAGTCLPAGAQTLSVTFTPTNPAHQSVTATVPLTVLKATPTLHWPNPANIFYGTLLSSAQLDATAGWVVCGGNVTVPGVFTYVPPVGTLLPAGTHTLTVTLNPADSANYNMAVGTTQLVVLKATPTINWTNPPDIDHGTPLDATQLNATATSLLGAITVAVAGVFAYTPAAGTVLGIGPNQPLAVHFAPTDTANYNAANRTVHINVHTGYPIVMSVTFFPTTLQWEERLEVTCLVKNDSIHPHPTQGPDPGFEYSEGDTFQTKGFPSVSGAYRIGVDLEETTYAVDHLYRWGFGHTLAPGESVVVNGFIRFHNSRHNGHYYVGMIKEENQVVEDHQGTTGITVERP